jgi:HlyD family secretion protein
MTTPLDLKELSVRRDRAEAPLVVPRRHFISRYVLPGTLILGFVALLGWSFRDAFLPRKPVLVVPVQATVSEIRIAGTPLFKAAGWIEPRPTAIRVAALAPGVVEQLLVVEDQEVKEGEPIARLVARDAELELQQARAAVGLKQAEIAEAEAALAAARTNLEFPLHLEVTLAEAQTALAVIETEITNLPNQLKRAEARLKLAQNEWDTKSVNLQAIQPVLIYRAEAELATSKAEVDEFVRRLPRLVEQRDSARRRAEATKRRLELKTEEQRAVKGTEAGLKVAQAKLLEAEITEATAQLRLDRMTIHAPVAGRILHLIANPGSQLMTGPSQVPDRDASTVVTMYQPDRLQVRVDVRFEDLPRVGRDQLVQVSSPALAAPVPGKVLFLTSSANVQKNTLGVKVALEDAPSVIKPEMLVDVTFLAPERKEPQKPSQDLRLFLPRSLVEESAEGPHVWVADMGRGIAVRRRVELGDVQTPSILEIKGGLTAGTRVISQGRESLQDGDRIEIRGEDPAVGTAGASALPAADGNQHGQEH